MNKLDEIADLVAEAARTSRHAKRAYELMEQEFRRDLQPLPVRQRLIADRMKDAA